MDYANELRKIADDLHSAAGPGHLARVMSLAADEIEETDRLRTRLGELLTATANALKGPPPPLTLHSWHDLARLAERHRQALQAIARELACDGPGCPWCKSGETHPASPAARIAQAALEPAE